MPHDRAAPAAGDEQAMTLDINVVGCEEDIAEIQRRYDAGDPVAKFLIDNSSIREKPDCRKCKHDRPGTEHRLCDSYEVCMYERRQAP